MVFLVQHRLISRTGSQRQQSRLEGPQPSIPSPTGGEGPTSSPWKPEAASGQAQEPAAKASLSVMEMTGSPEPEAATSGQALRPLAETFLCVMDAKCFTPPPAVGAHLPARESGCEPMGQPPPAAEGLPGRGLRWTPTAQSG